MTPRQSCISAGCSLLAPQYIESTPCDSTLDGRVLGVVAGSYGSLRHMRCYPVVRPFIRGCTYSSRAVTVLLVQRSSCNGLGLRTSCSSSRLTRHSSSALITTLWSSKSSMIKLCFSFIVSSICFTAESLEIYEKTILWNSCRPYQVRSTPGS